MSDANKHDSEQLILQPGTLWNRVVAQTALAIQCGALQSISTDCEVVESEGMDFIIRVIAHLARKDAVAQPQLSTAAKSKPVDPFLPYEPELFVTDISPTHLALLNKFNVVEHHLLIVTRAFEAQDTWLTLADFEALCACMVEMDGFAFYNGGQVAGASQTHKHLQLLPLPFAPVGPPLPLSPIVESAKLERVGTIPNLPFIHEIAPLHLDWTRPSDVSAQAMLDCYHALLTAVGWSPQTRAAQPHLAGTYNLLVTRRWMLLVPRSQESFQGIPVNALGFAGSLLARNVTQLQQVKELGPMTVLKNVAVMPSEQ